jgi:hypothetical protein
MYDGKSSPCSCNVYEMKQTSIACEWYGWNLKGYTGPKTVQQ